MHLQQTAQRCWRSQSGHEERHQVENMIGNLALEKDAKKRILGVCGVSSGVDMTLPAHRTIELAVTAVTVVNTSVSGR